MYLYWWNIDCVPNFLLYHKKWLDPILNMETFFDRSSYHPPSFNNRFFSQKFAKAKRTFWIFWKFPFGRMVLIPRYLWICGASQQNHTSPKPKTPKSCFPNTKRFDQFNEQQTQLLIHQKKLSENSPKFKNKLLTNYVLYNLYIGCSDRSSTKDLSIPSEAQTSDCRLLKVPSYALRNSNSSTKHSANLLLDQWKTSN